MADERIALITPIEKGAHSDLVRGLLDYAAERMMELEVTAGQERRRVPAARTG